MLKIPLPRKQKIRMKKINVLLRKCKTLSRQLGRTSSYSSLRSQSTREELWVAGAAGAGDEHRETIFVGSSRRRYSISSKYLSHPLMNALIEKSRKLKQVGGDEEIGAGAGGQDLSVKCEVVLFEHLLWMLDNADPHHLSSDSLDELADLYVF